MFNHEDMATIVGYNDGFFNEPVTRAYRMPYGPLRVRYLVGWTGGMMARMQSETRKMMRRWRSVWR